jgi:hypothetical protein
VFDALDPLPALHFFSNPIPDKLHLGWGLVLRFARK